MNDNEPIGAEPTQTDVTPPVAPTTETTPSTSKSIFGSQGSGSATEQHQPEVNPQGGESEFAPVNPTTPASVSAPVPANMTPEQIAQIASQSALQAQQQFAQQQAQAQQPRQYTPKELNLFQVDEQLFNQIFDSEDKNASIAAMNNMLQGAVKQAFTMAQLQYQQEMDQRFTAYDQRINPHIAFAQQQQKAHMAQTFFAEHKDLVGMDQVVSQVTAGLRQEGRQFASEKELFAEVATRTKAIIQHISGGQQPAQVVGQGQIPQQTVPAQTTQKPAMATVGAGGTGGAGGGQGAAAGTPNAAKSIFS